MSAPPSPSPAPASDLAQAVERIKLAIGTKERGIVKHSKKRWECAYAEVLAGDVAIVAGALDAKAHTEITRALLAGAKRAGEQRVVAVTVEHLSQLLDVAAKITPARSS